MATSFDIRRSHDTVMALVQSGAGVAEGMAAAVDYCAQRHPEPAWGRVRRLDWAADVEGLRGWLRRVLRDEPPGAEIGAFWFGLFEPVRNGRATCGLYFAGVECYEPDQPEPDAFSGLSYLPASRYSESPVLDAIYRFGECQRDGARDEAHYTLCLAYAGLACCELLSTVNPALLLGPRQVRTAAFGFDSGDTNPLGYVRRDGLQRWRPGARA